MKRVDSKEFSGTTAEVFVSRAVSAFTRVSDIFAWSLLT